MQSTAQFTAVDVRHVAKLGLLRKDGTDDHPGTCYTGRNRSVSIDVEDKHVVLRYRLRLPSGDLSMRRQVIALTWTDCHFGGERPWFVCPGHGCNRRVAVLYGGTFACRHCHDLVYPSQREHADDRATRELEKIRRRLGWPPGFLNGKRGKPKGMHWKTYHRLLQIHDELTAGIIRSVNIHLGIERKG